MVDIVFVHGLNGDPQTTWTAEKSKIFWPAQLLPKIVEEEKARILTYGYETDISSFADSQSKRSLANYAEHLIGQLVANRRLQNANERPLVFVAHSLGGLLVKDALAYSAEFSGARSEHLQSIFISTYGILFLGTPHTGSSNAEWVSCLERICDAVFPRKLTDNQSQLIGALKNNCETLQDINHRFLPLLSQLHIYSFYELKPTKVKGVLKHIVDKQSVYLMVAHEITAPINTDHFHMCKFEDDSAPGFDLVVGAIQRYAADAPSAIAQRWKTEKEDFLMRQNQGQATASNASLEDEALPTPLQKRTYQACIPCRKRKVRCDLGPVDEPHDPPCVRCRREGKDCFFSATRKRHKASSKDSQPSKAGPLEDENAALPVKKKDSRSSDFYGYGHSVSELLGGLL